MSQQYPGQQPGPQQPQQPGPQQPGPQQPGPQQPWPPQQPGPQPWPQQQPGPQQPWLQQQWQPQPPPKKKHTVRNVLLIIGAVMILGIGGCVAFLGAVGNELSKDDATGGRNQPVTVQPGQAFTIGKHETQAGWKVIITEDRMFSVTGKVKNVSDTTSTALCISSCSTPTVKCWVTCSATPVTLSRGRRRSLTASQTVWQARRVSMRR